MTAEGLEERLTQNFKFKEMHRQKAENTINKVVKEHLNKIRSKKRRRKLKDEMIFVGIHVR